MATGADIEKQKSQKLFEENWTDKMVEIWREKLELFHAIDTGNLYGSVKGTITHGNVTRIEHTFAMYGIYVNNGVGIFYKGHYENGEYVTEDKGTNDLHFLDPQYRREHKLDIPRRVGPAWGGRIAGGHPRKVRAWLWKRYYSSCKKLGEVIAELNGDDYKSLIFQALSILSDREGNVQIEQAKFIK